MPPTFMDDKVPKQNLPTVGISSDILKFVGVGSAPCYARGRRFISVRAGARDRGSMGAQRSENFMPLSSFFRKGPLCEVPRPTCIRMPDISKIMGMVFCCYAQRIVKLCNKDLIL